MASIITHERKEENSALPTLRLKFCNRDCNLMAPFDLVAAVTGLEKEDARRAFYEAITPVEIVARVLGVSDQEAGWKIVGAVTRDCVTHARRDPHYGIPAFYFDSKAA